MSVLLYAGETWTLLNEHLAPVSVFQSLVLGAFWGFC